MTAVYVDANILVYAFGDATHPKRTAARLALEDAADKGDLVTSILTIDEFAWARRKEADTATAIDDTRKLLKAPVLRFMPVEIAHAHVAMDEMERHGLRPRDAFHVAVARGTRCTSILSDDPDLDGIRGLKRVSP